MIDGLAFLPVDDVADGMGYLKDNTPDGLEGLFEYFDKTYVSGSFRRIQRAPVDGDDEVQPVRVRRVQPLFPPQLWNVHQTTIDDKARTNNMCESWNNAFQKLIGYNHPTVWVAIEAFRKDQSSVETAFYNNANGQPPQKRVKKVMKDLQQRLQNLCRDYVNGTKTVPEFLQGVGRTIRLKC